MSLWPVCNGPTSKRGAMTEGHTAAFQRGFRDGLTWGLCLAALLVGLALILVLHRPALAAREPLLIDATARTFHWTADYARGRSPQGPSAEMGNLALHLTPGLYDDAEWRPARVAVYDATPDRARVFLATGYQFEARACGAHFLILNWTGTMGDQELTLIQLDLTDAAGRWQIATVTLTRYATPTHTTLEDVAPWAATCAERSD